jgi:hypothetical protein
MPDLRDRHLLKFTPDNLSAIELSVPGQPAIEFKGGKNERWQITKPRLLRADGLEIDALEARLKEAEMDPVAQDALGNDKVATAGFAGGKPVGTVKITAGSLVETLEVRNSGADYFARSSTVPGVFKVSAAVGQSLNKKLADFQNRKLFDFGFDDATKIEWKAKDNTITFEKVDANWLSNGRVMDSVAVQTVIDKLRELTAARVDDVSASAPEIDVTVVSKKGTETVRLAPAGSDYIGARPGDQTLYRLDGGTTGALRQAFFDVREAPLPEKDKGKIKK